MEDVPRAFQSVLKFGIESGTPVAGELSSVVRTGAESCARVLLASTSAASVCLEYARNADDYSEDAKDNGNGLIKAHVLVRILRHRYAARRSAICVVHCAK